jgi:hypothetical protein
VRLADITKSLDMEKTAVWATGFKGFFTATKRLASGLAKDISSVGRGIETGGYLAGKVYRSSVPAAKAAWGATKKTYQAATWPHKQIKSKMMLRKFDPARKSYSVVSKQFTGKGIKGELYGVPGEYVAKTKAGKAAMSFTPEYVTRRATKGQKLRHRVGQIGAGATHPIAMGLAGLTALGETAKTRQPMTGPTYF